MINTTETNYCIQCGTNTIHKINSVGGYCSVCGSLSDKESILESEIRSRLSNKTMFNLGIKSLSEIAKNNRIKIISTTKPKLKNGFFFFFNDCVVSKL